jgi:hypothetical protein
LQVPGLKSQVAGDCRLPTAVQILWDFQKDNAINLTAKTSKASKEKIYISFAVFGVFAVQLTTGLPTAG